MNQNGLLKINFQQWPKATPFFPLKQPLQKKEYPFVIKGFI
jgi:hypothetical protein